MTDWNDRFLSMAELVSGWSKDPSTKVGAVIVREDNTVASVGFNGFPRFMTDDAYLYDHRPTKYKRTIHAEVNAVLNAHESVDGCTIYVTAPCCTACALVLIQSGIERVVYPSPSEDLLSRWGSSINDARDFFEEAGVEVTEV